MWRNSIKTLTNNRFLNIIYKVLPIASILYFSLTSIIPRNTYPFLKKPTIEKKIFSNLLIVEKPNNKKIRYKLNQDIKYHQLNKNWYKKTITKISLNEEGKIIGYKMNSIFYPNYFTKTQLKNIIPKSEIFPFKKTNIQIVKITFTK
nr:hypothetical protein [Hemiselmis andersenii]